MEPTNASYYTTFSSNQSNQVVARFVHINMESSSVHEEAIMSPSLIVWHKNKIKTNATQFVTLYTQNTH
jgi:hypothetical protein